MRLITIPDDQINAIKLGKLPRRPLGVTPGGDDKGIWVSATGEPQKVARFSVSDMGHGAGVKDVDIGIIWIIQNLAASLSKSPLKVIRLRLI